MRLLRGRAETPEADRALTGRAVDRVAEDGKPAVRVWTPPRQVTFGRRDARAEGYERARRHAREHGYPPVERSTGGRAVAFTGATVAAVRATPTDTTRTGVDDRYEDALDRFQAALARLGVDAEPGEPDASFCPGTHSLRTRGKLVGLAQRVRGDVAVLAGVVVVRDRAEIGAVLDPVYDALGVTFDPGSVGSVVAAGGPEDPQRTVDALEAALTDGDTTVTPVG